MLERMTKFSMDRPKTVIGLAIILTILFGLQFPKITIDTDPENMLEANQPDRVLYNRIKKDFGINDLIVVGIVDEKGIFRSEALERVARVTSEILKIKGGDHRGRAEPYHHGQRQIVRRAPGYPPGDAENSTY